MDREDQSLMVRCCMIVLSALLLFVMLLRCVGAAVIFSDGFECPQCPPPPPVLTYCEQAALDPLMQPAGRSGVIRQWSQTFFAAPFYTPTSYPHPVGSVTMADLPAAWHWLSVEFVAESASVYWLDWAEAQTLVNPQAGIRYSGRPAHSAFFTISPCLGDFRVPVNGTNDNYLRSGCRRSGAMESIRFRTDLPQSSATNCALQAGDTYYLNIGFFEPGEIDPSVTTCMLGDRCEVNVVPQ